MTNPNDIQHGGDHYKKAGNAQHWDMLPHCGFGWEYYIGCATKYVTRVKHPDLDPQKSAHFIDKLIHLIDTGMVPAEFNTIQGKRLHVDNSKVPYAQRVDIETYLNEVYFPANNLRRDSVEAQVVFGLMMARTVDELRAVRKLLAYMTGEATKEYVQQDAQSEQAAAAARLQAAMTTANSAAVAGRAVAVEAEADTVQIEAGGGTDAQAAAAAAGKHDQMIKDYDNRPENDARDDGDGGGDD